MGTKTVINTDRVQLTSSSDKMGKYAKQEGWTRTLRLPESITPYANIYNF